MRVTFVLPFVHPGGGVRIVLQHARGLRALGHEATVIYPGPRGTSKQYAEPERTLRSFKYGIDARLGKREHDWFGTDVPVIRVPDLRASHIPNADIVVATSNETADWVKDYPRRCGVGAYFIQDHETWNRDRELVDATWRYPLAKITISKWLVDLGKTLGVEVMGPVPNGIDTGLFYEDPPTPHPKRANDIVMIYRQSSQKGCARGIEILNKVKQARPETTFTFFGRDTPPHDLLELGSFVSDPPQDLIRTLYTSARVFFLPSFQEGFAGPPLEATSCGCAVVSTLVGGPMDVFTAGSDAWLAPANDDAALEAALLDAVSRSDEATRRAAKARSVLTSYTWERSTAMLERLFQQLLPDAQKP